MILAYKENEEFERLKNESGIKIEMYVRAWRHDVVIVYKICMICNSEQKIKNETLTSFMKNWRACRK